MSRSLPGTPVEHEPCASPHAEYESLLAQGFLPFQACGACCAAIFPPRQRCAACGAPELTWRKSQGRGQIYSSTVLSPRGQDAYAVVLVDVAEGYRMMSRIVGPADEVQIGATVQVQIVESETTPLPMFVLEKEAGR